MKALIQTLWRSRMIHFLLVGLLNTIAGYALFSFFIFLGLHYTIAALFSNTLGAIFNFKTTGHLVFKNTDNRLFLKFFFLYVGLYLLNIILVKLFYMLTHNYYGAGALAVCILPFVSFFTSKYYIFSQQPKQ